jgi:EpsD family peptidyl-prolyl cis-trans isomerase
MANTRIALLAGLALALAACNSKEATPDGQVVATVDGKDVTIHELNAEVALLRTGESTPRKLLEQVALARVIERKMLASEARKLKLDASPQFLLARTRAEEGLMVQALQAEVQSKVQPPTREAAQKFITENPQVFADRKLFTVDQIQFLQPPNFEKLPLKDAKTMADVESILIESNIEYRRAPQQIDTLLVNPKLTDQIVKLTNAPNPEPFMFVDQPPNAVGPVVFINNVTATKTQPFIGERAIAYAQAVLQQQDIQKRLASELEKWKEEYKPKIVYAKGYGEPDPKLIESARQAVTGRSSPQAGKPADSPAPKAAAPAAEAPAG